MRHRISILFWFANSKKLPCKDSSLNGLKLICGKQDGIGSTWFQLKAHEKLYFLKKGSQSQFTRIFSAETKRQNILTLVVIKNTESRT